MKASVELRHEHDAVLFALRILDKMSEVLISGGEVSPDDLAGIMDFIETFIDKCHHGKEEKIYFPALEKAGMLNSGGPIGVMLAEHQTGRAYVRLMADSLRHEPFHRDKFIKAAEDYAALLRSHIEKENSMLFDAGDSKLPRDTQESLLEKFEELEEMVIGKGRHEELHKRLDYFREKYF